MCYQNREVKILNDLNDRDLNDRKTPLNIYLLTVSANRYHYSA